MKSRRPAALALVLAAVAAGLVFAPTETFPKSQRKSGQHHGSRSAEEAAKPTPATVPVPATRPKTEPKHTAEQPGIGGPNKLPPGLETPVPTPKPAATQVPENGNTPAKHGDAPATLPPDEVGCRVRLKALGVAFAERPPETSLSGCKLPYPIKVTRLSESIALQPAALLNCSMAEAASRFARDVMAPAARDVIGADLVSIDQASAYVCRPRHGTARLSEHAFGNALDMARFTFSDGSEALVGARGELGARFVETIRKAACGPFKTVLGPGSDPDHAKHLHLDLARRTHGGTFCQ